MLFDSDVILEFLDTLHDNQPLIPQNAKFESKTAIHLANCIIESTLLRTMELRRSKAEQSKSFDLTNAANSLNAQYGQAEDIFGCEDFVFAEGLTLDNFSEKQDESNGFEESSEAT